MGTSLGTIRQHGLADVCLRGRGNNHVRRNGQETHRYVTSLFSIMFVGLGFPRGAAGGRRPVDRDNDRGGKTYPTIELRVAGDAAGRNGDAEAIKAYLETIIPPQIWPAQ